MSIDKGIVNNAISLYTISILVHLSSPTGGAKHDGGDIVNESDVDGIRQVLDGDRVALNRRITTHRHRLVRRLRAQLIQRAPKRSVADGATEQFIGFARWLESCKTLERTYRDEQHGGHSRSWAVSAAAKEVSILRSNSLRQMLERDGELSVESPDWALRELESQLNHWRGLTIESVPVWIHIQYEPLQFRNPKLQLLYPRGAYTLSFTLTDNGEEIA